MTLWFDWMPHMTDLRIAAHDLQNLWITSTLMPSDSAIHKLEVKIEDTLNTVCNGHNEQA